MKALVIGASGQVGGALLKALAARGHTAAGTYRAHAQPGLIELDAANVTAVEHLIDHLHPDWVFYPAGLSWVDLCEREAARCFDENVRVPVAVAACAARQGAGFVYYSSEYVFDGEGGPYDEAAAPRPINVYGRSKLAAEQELPGVNPATVLVRTTVVYGPELQGKNFVCQLIDKLRRGESMVVPDDQVSTPTYNADLAAASVECVERRLTGVIHLTGPDRLARSALAVEACRIFDLGDRLIVPRPTFQLGQLAARPLNAGLISRYAPRLLSTRLRGVAEGLRAMRTELAAIDQSAG